MASKKAAQIKRELRAAIGRYNLEAMEARLPLGASESDIQYASAHLKEAAREMELVVSLSYDLKTETGSEQGGKQAATA